MTEITFVQCGPKPGQTFEDWQLVGLVDDGTEQREEIEAADKLDRTMCDCCQEHQVAAHDLTASGPDMLCDGCCPVLETKTQ